MFFKRRPSGFTEELVTSTVSAMEKQGGSPNTFASMVPTDWTGRGSPIRGSQFKRWSVSYMVLARKNISVLTCYLVIIQDN